MTTHASDKRDHVRRARDTGGHHCHFPGCGKACKAAYWGCRGCWMKLPQYLRDKVWEAYRPGQEIDKRPSRDYVLVALEVKAWIAEHYPEAVAKEEADRAARVAARGPTQGDLFA